jgi:hypothetical protein
MNTYKASFFGRPLGSVGFARQRRAEVKAPNEEEARLKLYEKHEHIHALRLELKSKEPTPETKGH